MALCVHFSEINKMKKHVCFETMLIKKRIPPFMFYFENSEEKNWVLPVGFEHLVMGLTWRGCLQRTSHLFCAGFVFK